jgi:hypothetical protein
MTVLESLKGVNGYPVPEITLSDVADLRGLDLSEEATAAMLGSRSYRLAKADVLMWVSFAPNVQQGDVSYSLLYSDRQEMRSLADAIYDALGDGAYARRKTEYGYKGNRL